MGDFDHATLRGPLDFEELRVLEALGFETTKLRKRLVDPALHGGFGERIVPGNQWFVAAVPKRLDQATVDKYGCAPLHEVGAPNIPEHLKRCAWLPYLIAAYVEPRRRALPARDAKPFVAELAQRILDELHMAWCAGGAEARANVAEAIARGDW